jgi:hypothetical protein
LHLFLKDKEYIISPQAVVAMKHTSDLFCIKFKGENDLAVKSLITFFENTESEEMVFMYSFFNSNLDIDECNSVHAKYLFSKPTMGDILMTFSKEKQ